MISPLGYAASFMFLCALLSLGVIYSRVHWMLKAAMVLFSLAFGVLFYWAHVEALGYPVAVQPPELFRLLAADVHEPASVNGDAGAIYMWIIVDNSRQPRALALPYSDDLRKKMAQAKKKLQHGDMVFMGKSAQAKAGSSGSKAKAGNQKPGKGGGNNQVPYQLNSAISLDFKQPPNTLPKKEPQQEISNDD